MKVLRVVEGKQRLVHFFNIRDGGEGEAGGSWMYSHCLTMSFLDECPREFKR